MEEQRAVLQQLDPAVAARSMLLAIAEQSLATRSGVPDGMGVGFVNVRAEPDNSADQIVGNVTAEGRADQRVWHEKSTYG